MTDFLGEARHLGDAACVVGDGSVRVDGDDDAGHREHRSGGNGDAVKPAEAVADKDADGDHHHREGRRHHPYRLAGNDVRGVPCHGRLGDQVHRPVSGLGEELGDRDDEDCDDDADQPSEEQVVGVAHAAARLQKTIHAHVLGHEVKADDRHRDRHQKAGVKGAHDPLRVVDADEECSDDRADDADGAQKQRIDHPTDLVLEQQGAQQHRGDHRHGVGLEEVGGHACAVAHVVPHVVSDHRRVPWIVLRDSSLQLADEVRADVSRLRVDTAAQAGEDRHQARAEGEADEGFGILEDEIGCRHAKQPQPDDHEPCHGAAPERHLESLVEPVSGPFRGAEVGADRDVHAHVAGGCREDCADDVERSCLPVDGDPDDYRNDHTDDRDHRVLAVEVGGGALLDGGSDLLHARVARRHPQDEGDQDEGEDDGGGATGHREQDDIGIH